MSSSAGPPEPPVGETASPRWSRLLHQSDDPLFVLNARRRLLYVNPAWERWSGLTFGDVRSQPCRASAVRNDPQAAILGLLAPTKEALAGHTSQVRRRGAIANAPWIDVHFFPWKKDGAVVGIIGRIDAVAAVPTTQGPPLPEKIVQLRERAARSYRLELWESDVPAVQTAVAQARLASQTTVPVLLHGPPGSGKEWLARTIHRHGLRREEFFACLDAQTLPPSILANLILQPTTRLNLGAILLRRPGHLRSDIQVRLAEMLGDDTFGPRLFVAVDDNAEASRLSPDLLGRVNALSIRVPPLAERRADWPRLLPEFLARAAAVASKPHLTLAPDAEQTLRLHAWPGNWRELEQTLRNAALHVAGDRIELIDLPFSLRGEPPPQEPKLPLDDLLQNAERKLILLALDQARHNKSKAAQLLGIWRARLLRRMEQLGIADDKGDPADA